MVVCLALLRGYEDSEIDQEMSDIAKSIAVEGGREYAGAIIACLSYLRDRIGVPRDMKLPAARQLRAHLNWATGKVLAAAEASS